MDLSVFAEGEVISGWELFDVHEGEDVAVGVEAEMNFKGHRRRNYNDAGHAHELTFSCYHRIPFFKSAEYSRWMVESIESARKKIGFDLWAYVVMPDHVHLLIHPRETMYDIASIRWKIKSDVAARIIEDLDLRGAELLERMTRRRGSKSERLVWQSGGGYDRNIDNPTTLMKCIDYLHLNPVRKNFVSKASEWEWSIAAWFEGQEVKGLVPDRIPSDWLV